MRRWLDTYFGFSNKEFNGLMVLVVLIGLTMLAPYIYGLVKEDEPVTAAEKMAVLKLALKERDRMALIAPKKQKFKYNDKRKAALFYFDPNTIGQDAWQRLGLSAKQASAILNYTAKGGRFRKVEDLKKMYTINDAMYNRLKPYVKIDDVGAVKDQPKIYNRPNYESKAAVLVEINGADTTELDKIKGVGKTFANRIVKYRDRIGGFYKKEQLMEVFGLDSLKYMEIKDQVLIDGSKIKKINVNKASIEDFKNHPYIRYKQANAMIAYRKQHGNYSNFADLNKVAILNVETINRLAAYLEF